MIGRKGESDELILCRNENEVTYYCAEKGRSVILCQRAGGLSLKKLMKSLLLRVLAFYGFIAASLCQPTGLEGNLCMVVFVFLHY